MGTVIKASGAGKIKKHLATLGLKDHMAEAQRIVRDARLRAVQVLEDAHVDVVRRGEEAKRKGYARGYEEGRIVGERTGREEAFAAAKAEFLGQQDSLLAALETMMSSFEDRKSELLDRARHDVLLFAVAIAERIVKRTAAVDRQAAAENAKEAVRVITDATDIEIRTHPADMETMRKFAEQDAGRLIGRRHVSVVEDETVGMGGCVVYTQATRVDGTVAGQLRHATALLLAETDDRRPTDDADLVG